MNWKDASKLNYLKAFNSDLESYIIKQFQYLGEIYNKGFGFSQNAHIYKDKNGNKEQSNLICYLLFSSPNIVELNSHNPSSFDYHGNQFTGAGYFNNLLQAIGIVDLQLILGSLQS